MASSKKVPLNSSEKLYRTKLFYELNERINKTPISDRSKLFVVGMVRHKIVEGMKK